MASDAPLFKLDSDLTFYAISDGLVEPQDPEVAAGGQGVI